MREPRNAHDRYAVAIEKDSTVISHLPKFCGGKIFVVEGTRKFQHNGNFCVYDITVL